MQEVVWNFYQISWRSSIGRNFNFSKDFQFYCKNKHANSQISKFLKILWFGTLTFYKLNFIIMIMFKFQACHEKVNITQFLKWHLFASFHKSYKYLSIFSLPKPPLKNSGKAEKLKNWFRDLIKKEKFLRGQIQVYSIVTKSFQMEIFPLSQSPHQKNFLYLIDTCLTHSSRIQITGNIGYSSLSPSLFVCNT